MKIICRECDGNGVVECPCCSGNGTNYGRIDTIKITATCEHADELLELQKDARRVIAQCAELKTLRPEFSEKYDEQLAAVIAVIDRQAEEVSTKD